MLFASASLARRIEAAESEMVAEFARTIAAKPGRDAFVTPLAGGLAIFGGPGSPMNKVAGLGFAGVPSERELVAIEEGYAARKTPVQVELSELADPGVGKLLTQRGYVLVGFENVLGRALASDPGPASASIEVRRAGRDEMQAWVDVAVAGFSHPDVDDGPPSHEHFNDTVMRAVMDDMREAPGFTRLLAVLGGVVAGAASMRTHTGVALLCGAATLPPLRRQGVQTELLRWRLAEARAQGCELATMTTLPGSKSAENAHKRGFALLYARAILVR